MAQLMPLPLTVSCFSKIQIGFTFLVPADPGSPGKRAVKWVCVGVDFPIATGFSVDKAVVVDACSLCSDAVESELQFVGLIVFENKLKPETAPVIHELQDANIRNVMVTGMHSCFLVSSGSLPYLGFLLVNNNSCLIALAERV